MPASFLTAAGLDENNTFTGANVFSGSVTFSGTTVDEGAQAIAPAVSASGSPTVPLVVTAAADTAMTASTEASSVYFNLSAARQFATGALTTQRAFRIAAPTYAFVGASTITNAATLYVDAAPAAGTNATITNAYSLFVDAGRARFDGAVVQNDFPVVRSTGTVASPVTTIGSPAGVTVVASGATSVSVTCDSCTAETIISATIMNATSNNVSVRAVIPSAGSFVVHLTGDPGVSTAIVGVLIAQPGSGV